ncbi:MAG: CcmD family protein [Acidobacteriota bacterium]
MAYLFAAYCFVWLALFGYLRYLQNRLNSLQTEVERLKDAVEKP